VEVPIQEEAYSTMKDVSRLNIIEHEEEEEREFKEQE
jgi:hypothetical protein